MAIFTNNNVIKKQLAASNKNSSSSVTHCSSHESNLDKSRDRKLQRNIQSVVVVSQWVTLVIKNQFNHWRELQWLDKSKLAILVKDLYQLITSTFPVNNNLKLMHGELITTTTILRPFAWDYLGESVPERQTILNFAEAEMIGWQWYQLNHMQAICTSLQEITMPASTSSLRFLRVGYSS